MYDPHYERPKLIVIHITALRSFHTLVIHSRCSTLRAPEINRYTAPRCSTLRAAQAHRFRFHVSIVPMRCSTHERHKLVVIHSTATDRERRTVTNPKPIPQVFQFTHERPKLIVIHSTALRCSTHERPKLIVTLHGPPTLLWNETAEGGLGRAEESDPVGLVGGRRGIDRPCPPPVGGCHIPFRWPFRE